MNPILQALQRVPSFRLDSRYGGHSFYGRVNGLMLRVRRLDDIVINDLHPWASLERRWVVEIAESKTFDRWANSVNFATEVVWSRKGGWTVPDFKREFAWCRKVCRSRLFTFNNYFATVKTPWFIHPKS
jgi:hypothetical protein